MENGVRKREWVKTAAIILLAVLLVLTFFSKTIMNASLPEVATQQVSSGAINARIRGQGTVEASEVYNVTIKQTRKVSSVLVKTGQEINVGDTLFVLEAEDSDELKQAETDLETLQQNYDKSLIEAGNTAAQENRDVQNAAVQKGAQYRDLPFRGCKWYAGPSTCDRRYDTNQIIAYAAGVGKKHVHYSTVRHVVVNLVKGINSFRIFSG